MKLYTLVTCLLISLTSYAEVTVRFALYRSENAVDMYRKFKPLTKEIERIYLKKYSEKLKVELKIFADYVTAHKALLSGDADFARMGPASFILLKEKDPKLFLLACEGKKGQLSFDAVCVTQKTNSIKTTKGLKGRSIAFGNEFSTIGRYWAQALLVKEKIFSKELKNWKFLGRHDKVAMSVLTGNYDAGFIKGSIYRKYDKKQKLRVITRAQIPNKPWIASSKLDEEMQKRLQETILEINSIKILALLKITGFKKVDLKFYDGVRDLIDKSKGFEQ